ncbi:type 1 glutamine amidotransferase [Candidatus Bathyarchaeota archaeon]|nr:type 1 glutamine amidotransferase [Candidatus Bathyarchaeota archaeon]
MKRKALIFVDEEFEDVELIYPYYRLQEAGFKVYFIGSEANKIYKGKRGISVTSNLSPKNLNINEYDVIIIPGGRAPDKMRMNKELVDLIKEAFKKGKIIAAICHGPQMLIEADVIKGRKVTGYKSISTDLKNAGAKFIDEPVVVDGNIITSRKPDDLPYFCKEILNALTRLNE